MNIFTTEHPLASQPSWLDTKEHPFVSFACNVILFALGLMPIVLLGFLYYAADDISAETTPSPTPLSALPAGIVVAFAFSLAASFLAVSVYRLFARS